MDAVDGTWNDDVIEDVIISFTTPTATGTYWYCVYGWDQWLNYNVTGDCATLTIADDLPPEIDNVQIDGALFQSYGVSSLPSTVTLTATVNDALTGNSNISGANYTLGQFSWTSSQFMNAVDGTWDDDASEDISLTFSTPVAPGTYTYCVYGWDEVPNYNVTSTACAALTIIDDTQPPTEPPEISDVRAEPSPQTVGNVVKISATVTDEDTDVDDLAVTIHITDPKGTLVDQFEMIYDSETDKFEYSSNFSLVGNYTFVIYAEDEDKNSDSAAGSFEMVPEAREFNWKPIIALFFTIILLILGIIISYKRPLRFKGNLRKDKVYTFLFAVLPFVIAESITGLISLFTGLLSVPPILGIGMLVDLMILISGVIVCMVILKKGYRANESLGQNN